MRCVNVFDIYTAAEKVLCATNLTARHRGFLRILSYIERGNIPQIIQDVSQFGPRKNSPSLSGSYGKDTRSRNRKN